MPTIKTYEFEIINIHYIFILSIIINKWVLMNISLLTKSENMIENNKDFRYAIH